jgi:thiamine biosynthesis lipoprotein
MLSFWVNPALDNFIINKQQIFGWQRILYFCHLNSFIHHMKNKTLLFLVASLIFLNACKKEAELQKIQFQGEAQGTYYAITYFAADTVVAQTQIDSLLDDFDQSASLWVENSLLMRINQNDPDAIPDQHLIELFKKARRVSEATDGAFDITVGPLVKVWGFWFEEPIKVNQQIVDSLLPLVDYRGVSIENDRIVKKNPNIQFDFNAIAQGYSVDLMGGFLEKNGIKNYLIDIGGEVFGKGQKPDGNPWMVGIEKPSKDADSDRQLKATINLNNRAVCTSGNYRKYYEVDGVRYSHAINPKTGFPAKNTLLSASILADSAGTADGYGTAMMVMGFDNAKKFIETHPELEAYFIYSGADGSLKTWMSKGLEGLIEEEK